MDIAELKSKSIGELHEMAEELDIHNFSGLRKQDLIFRIEQNLLDCDAVLTQLPIGAEADFQGVVDLITMKAGYFEGSSGAGVYADTRWRSTTTSG